MILVTVFPPSAAARLRTVYDVPGSSRVPAVQDFLSPDIVPGTGPDFEVTLTALRVPESAVTETRRSTGTAVAPLGHVGADRRLRHRRVL